RHHAARSAPAGVLDGLAGRVLPRVLFGAAPVGAVVDLQFQADVRPGLRLHTDELHSGLDDVPAVDHLRLAGQGVPDDIQRTVDGLVVLEADPVLTIFALVRAALGVVRV